MDWKYFNLGVLLFYIIIYWILFTQWMEYFGKGAMFDPVACSSMTKTLNTTTCQRVIRYSAQELFDLKSKFNKTALSKNDIERISSLGIKRNFRWTRGRRKIRPKVYQYNHGVHKHFLRTLPKLCIQYNKSRALSIGLVNIRSFNNKIDQFIHHFKSLDLDVCCVTESWIKNCELTILDDLNSVGLSLINIPRKGRTGGGISIISSSRLSSKTLRSGEHKSFEYGIFSVKCHGKELIFVIIQTTLFL